ncbi:protein xri1 [Phtheirospermum japonicum]|uniref:Protein xri1 n=1 Tax=Phtheirospermum japonicum TaxID=374723 RepID=A0A830BS48_9LAMI|nr:protein xri1 [Phtheirospermum japonicum]
MMTSISSPEASYGSDLMSTGYLEDVLFQFSSKRRRLIDDDDHYRASQFDDAPIKDCWTSDLIQDCYQDFDTLSEITKCDRNSDMKTPEEAISETYYDSSSSSQKESVDNYQWTPEKGNLYCIDPIFSSGDDEQRKKRLLAKVVYPFALVKPGGFEGDMTLNDINERILMPPTRPVRHPVGDFACRPLVSPDGPGLSGKAVVAFTRIQTQGRGTITIVRTRG